MRTIRIYHPDHLTPGATLQLTPKASHHLIQVLRATKDLPLQLFDGQGHCFDAEIIELGKKSVVVRLLKPVLNNTESSLQLHLGQALVRGEKMDFVIQKAVELGVHTLTPLLTEFINLNLAADRLEKRMRHWEEIIIHASEQCERDFLMVLNEPLPLETWLEKTAADLKFIFHPGDTVASLTPPANIETIAYAIGPEGGFSDREVEYAQRHDFHTLSLGSRILRTETAGIVGASVLQTRYGEWVEKK